eukprot:4395404-Amphidinium_carterae.1
MDMGDLFLVFAPVLEALRSFAALGFSVFLCVLFGSARLLALSTYPWDRNPLKLEIFVAHFKIGQSSPALQ